MKKYLMIVAMLVSMNVNAMDDATKCSKLNDDSLSPLETGYVMGLLAGARIYGGVGAVGYPIQDIINNTSYSAILVKTCRTFPDITILQAVGIVFSSMVDDGSSTNQLISNKIGNYFAQQK